MFAAELGETGGGQRWGRQEEDWNNGESYPNADILTAVRDDTSTVEPAGMPRRENMIA